MGFEVNCPPKGEFVFSGFICCFQTWNFSEWTILCHENAECLCCVREACCALDGEKSLANPLPIGLVTADDLICKLGLFCCTLGLKMPSVCCLGEGKCLCCRNGCAFPQAEPVPNFTCAIYGLRILPGPLGCGMPLYGGGAPPATDNQTMER
jgi:hypothetical protein